MRHLPLDFCVSEAVNSLFAEVLATARSELVNRPVYGAATATACAVVLGLLINFVFTTLSSILEPTRYPVVNEEKWDFFYTKAKANFLVNARSLIQAGFRKFAGPFYLITGHGPLIVLSPSYMDAVNKEDRLDLHLYSHKLFATHLDTFRTFRALRPGLFEVAVMRGLTRNLPKFTKPLSDEMSNCLEEMWGDSTEWHERTIRIDALSWVARLSALIFVGPKLSANEEWLRLSAEYTITVFPAAHQVRRWPRALQYFVERFSTKCRKVRERCRRGAKLLAPILAARDAEIALAKKEGREPNLPDDSIEWFRTAARGEKYHPIDTQLHLSIGAIHTTTDLLGQALLNLCKYPEVIQPLRDEAVEVLKKYGWQKVALTEVRLLDSFLKETQRLKPISMLILNRAAIEDLELPNGVKVKKGERIALSQDRMWDSSIYENAGKFDAGRFAKRRTIPSLENTSLLISTSKDHTGFGYGKHSCPGRFFAANEVKIALLQILLKYDLKIPDLDQAKPFEHGTSLRYSAGARISVRRRHTEYF